MTAVNPIRGEATVKIADGEYKLAATMEGLAQLSATTNCQTLGDLYHRMVNTELFMTRAALRAFVERGTVDGKELKKKDAMPLAVMSFSLGDAAAVQEGFVTILTALTREAPADGEDSDSGNRQAPSV